MSAICNATTSVTCATAHRRQSWRAGGREPQDFGQGDRGGRGDRGRVVKYYNSLSCTGSLKVVIF